MWLIFLLALLNAIANNNTFILQNRLQLGILPINVLDGLLILGCLCGFIAGTMSSTRLRTARVHPLLPWILAIFVLSTSIGFVAGIANGVRAYDIINTARNLLCLPAAVYLSYMLVGRYQSPLAFVRIHTLAGIGAAVMVTIWFLMGARMTKTVTNVRIIEYVSSYAGIAAALLIYTVASRQRFFGGRAVAGALAALCVVGQCATLSRSDWLAVAAAILCAYLLLSRADRKGKLPGLILSGTILVFFVWLSLFVGSYVTSRDLFEVVGRRLQSLLPRDSNSTDARAWDTRVPGLVHELGMWAQSPLWGQGLGSEFKENEVLGHDIGLRHNTWASTLAESGLLGLTAMLLTVGGTFVVGRRLLRQSWPGLDRGYRLMGVMGAVTGVYFFVHGMATMSFNTERWAILLGMICGAVLRCRAMQLEVARAWEPEMGPAEGLAGMAYPM